MGCRYRHFDERSANRFDARSFHANKNWSNNRLRVQENIAFDQPIGRSLSTYQHKRQTYNEEESSDEYEDYYSFKLRWYMEDFELDDDDYLVEHK